VWAVHRADSQRIEHHRRLARYCADLSRLSARIDSWSGCGTNTNGQHIRAAQTAYDQTLLLAAREVGVPAEVDVPLDSVERITIEAELSLAGLRWQVRQ